MELGSVSIALNTLVILGIMQFVVLCFIFTVVAKFTEWYMKDKVEKEERLSELWSKIETKPRSE